jgi:hypothetical protein
VVVSLIPTVLFPLLIILAAGLGISRWRRLLLVLSLIALVLLAFGAFFLRTILDVRLSNRIPDSIINLFQPLATPAIIYSSLVGHVGAFLALVLAARARSWGWFSALAVTTIISALAMLVAFNSYGLEIFNGSEQALSLYLSPLYGVISAVIVGLVLIAQVVYALFGPRDPEETRAAPANMPANATDVTLP